MKKLALLLILLVGGFAYSFAQQFTEVVYLKNGSIIKGVIIEEVPNVSLKIQTRDGNLFVFKIDEVAKITKESSSMAHRRINQKCFYDESKGVFKGYRGFVETGYIAGIGDMEENVFEISTSHGYQINSHVFVGAGMALFGYLDADVVAVPLFVNFRADFLDKRFSPFLDFKLGYSATDDVEGAYVAPSFGCRIGLKRNMALNVGVNYTYQVNNSHSDYSSYYYTDVDADFSGVGFKIGLEF